MCKSLRHKHRRAPVESRPNHWYEWAAQGQATLGQAAEALHGAPRRPTVRGDQAPAHHFDAVALTSRRSPDRLRPGVITSTRSPRRDQAELSKRIPFSNFAIRVPNARPDLRITQSNTSVYSISRCPPKGSAPQSGRGTEPPDRGSRRDRGEEASERAQIYRRRSLANAPSFIAGARRGQIGTTATRHRARPLCYLRLTEGATTIS